ncbi:retrovirus-related Pol polyprotein from transposon 412 [Trichonephila clavipes]|nr:retrovirus-related Pol polyprotein from transposon 412 [Trichonephila clavipes]
MRHLDFIAQYSTDIRHVQGNKNIVADALSRIKIDSITQSHMLNFRAFAEAQTIDSELQQFLHDSTSSLHLELKPCQISDHNLICDTSTGTPRPFVPTTFRKLIFEHLHNLSHPGIAATTKLICSRYVWPCMKKQIKTWVRGCDKCQRSKVQRHTKSPLGTFSTPDARFSHIHIDIVGPLPPSDGFQYLLTMIDRFSRWPEAVPIPDTTAKTISRAIFHHWIARFGCPSLITTDQGSQMRSSLFAEFTRILGTDRVKTTAYHPISNGLVERFHRHLKASIKAHESSRWTDVLPIVLLGIRSAVKEDLKASCAELVYGTTLRLPSDMLNVSIIPPCDEEFITSLRNIMRHLNPVATSTHGHSAHFVHPALSSCTHVFLRIDKVSPPLTQPYTGPHEVIARTDKTLQIIINSKPSWVSIDRVKPAFVSQDFDFPRAPKINTALKDITTSPKTVSEGQKQFSSSSKCLPSTTSTRTRSGRQSLGDTPVVNPPNGDRLIMIVCHLRVATQKMSQDECMKSRKWSH